MQLRQSHFYLAWRTHAVTAGDDYLERPCRIMPYFIDVEIRVVSARVWSINAGCARLLNARGYKHSQGYVAGAGSLPSGPSMPSLQCLVCPFNAWTSSVLLHLVPPLSIPLS